MDAVREVQEDEDLSTHGPRYVVERGLINLGILRENGIMLLWDEESASWNELIDRLSRKGKEELVLEVIGSCFASFRPSFEELFDEEAVKFLREATALFRQKFQESCPAELDEPFYENLSILREDDSSPGISSLIMAISFYADTVGHEMSTSVVEEIMSACYEAVVNSERISVVTPDAERQNENLVELIANQRKLIQAAIARL